MRRFDRGSWGQEFLGNLLNLSKFYWVRVRLHCAHIGSNAIYIHRIL